MGWFRIWLAVRGAEEIPVEAEQLDALEEMVKEWVRQTLRSIRPEMVSPESWETDLSVNQLIWRHLGDLFLHDWDSVSMTELLGSVIADIRKEDFDKLFEINPIFILAKSPAFCQKFHTSRDVPVVIFVDLELAMMSWEERQATAAHELAHVLLGHLDRPFSLDDPHREKQQEEADQMCRDWGFEIDAVRQKLTERRKEDGRE